jgi:hypothetical protein
VRRWIEDTLSLAIVARSATATHGISKNGVPKFREPELANTRGFLQRRPGFSVFCLGNSRA